VQFFEIPGHEDKKVIRNSFAAIAKELPCLPFGEAIGIGRPLKRIMKIIPGKVEGGRMCWNWGFGNLTVHDLTVFKQKLCY
jgi:hypothetical protein